MVLWNELRDLVASRFEEMVQPLRVVTDKLHSLLEQFESSMEGAAIALEVPAMVQMPLARASLLASPEGFFPVVEAMANQQEPAVESASDLEDLKFCGTPSSEERTTQELVTLDAEKLQEKELFQDFACSASGLPTDK